MSGDQWYNIGYTVVAPLIYGIVGYSIARWKTFKTRFRHPMTVLVNSKDIRIHELLAELRVRLGPCCMRAYLAQFHNGDEFITGVGMRKKSRTHEVAAPGVSYQAEHYQGLLISSVPEEMKLVIAEGPSFKTVESIADGKFRYLCQAGGICAVARAAIFMGKNVVAFVGVDFDSPERPKDIALVNEYAQRIQPLLAQMEGTLGQKLHSTFSGMMSRVAGLFSLPSIVPMYQP